MRLDAGALLGGFHQPRATRRQGCGPHRVGTCPAARVVAGGLGPCQLAEIHPQMAGRGRCSACPVAIRRQQLVEGPGDQEELASPRTQPCF